jgi:hypothetical protein
LEPFRIFDRPAFSGNPVAMPVRVRTKMGRAVPHEWILAAQDRACIRENSLARVLRDKIPLHPVIADGAENNSAIAIPGAKLENRSAYGPDAAPSRFPDQCREGVVAQGAREVTQLHPGFPVEGGRLIELLLRSRPSPVCGAGRSTPGRHSGSRCGARSRPAVRRRQAFHVLLDPGQDEERPLPVRQRHPA